MSEIINDLATIEVGSEMLQKLNVAGIYRDFSNNYKKLDNLKNFRSDYEQKNALMRWWHNDELQDAHLNSAEVQAEFSKTIGQLLMISIMQSKKLAEQQVQLNKQQDKLKQQADGIADNAGKLQTQHQVLAGQAEKLETLVREYFELKGLTEEGAQRLIDIANEVKATKDGMLQEFSVRSKDVEVLCDDIASQMASLSARMNDQIRQITEQAQSTINAHQQEMRAALAENYSALREQLGAAQQIVTRNIAKLEQDHCEAEASNQAKYAALESSLSSLSAKSEEQKATCQEKLGLIKGELAGLAARMTDVASDLPKMKAEQAICIEQQRVLQEAIDNIQNQVSGRIKRMGYLVTGLSVVVLGMLGGMVHLLS